MDTITHGVAGALIAKSLSDSPDQKLPRRAVILGSILPDLDLLAGLFSADDVFMLEFHRGITHSVVALPAFALLLGWLTQSKRRNWRLIAGGYAAGIASHIFLDVITAYGTMIFQPLSMDRYTLDLVFIIDLTLGCILLIPQLVAWSWSDARLGPRRAWLMWLFTVAGTVAAFFLVNAAGVRLSVLTAGAAAGTFALCFALPGLTGVGARWSRSRYCRFALGICLVYLVACGIAHRLAVNRVAELAAKYNVPAGELAALPSPPSLLRWSGLIKTPEGITRIPLDLTDTSDPSMARYVHSTPLPNQAELQALPRLQTYLWFARFPWVTTRESNAGTVVEYRDLQFLRPRPTDNPPFTFRVTFDRAGKLVAAGLSRR